MGRGAACSPRQVRVGGGQGSPWPPGGSRCPLKCSAGLGKGKQQTQESKEAPLQTKAQPPPSPGIIPVPSVRSPGRSNPVGGPGSPGPCHPPPSLALLGQGSEWAGGW